MNIVKPKNGDYCAIVVQIKTLVPLNNCDFVQHAIIMGNSVIVGKDTQINEIGLYFPLETQLSEAYLKANNLYRKKELNSDPEKIGYFKENGRIRCIKFRGNKSEGLFTPISSLSFIYPPNKQGGYNGIWLSDYFKLNEEFDELEGIEICRKYIPKSTKSQDNNKKDKHLKYESKLILNFKNKMIELVKNILNFWTIE